MRFLVCFSLLFSAGALAQEWRNIRTGHEIPSQGYADQPYVVVRDDGAWICTLTTGAGQEGKPGQHVVATISHDEGKTWSPLIDIEPADGPEASWAVPFITPYGRIYAFYSFNGDRLPPRADMLGWYCYRYSDDGGETWSPRYRLPLRVTAADRGNDWQGEHQIFWGICKPIVDRGDVLFTFTKLGKYMLELGEGWLYRSPNLLTERDPAKLVWELLPKGEHGIRHPDFGSIQEEHNIVALDNSDLFCIYRTTLGHPAVSYSRDRGVTWSTPEIATYTPGGPPIKHPRACPRVWKVRDGHYLLWYHNHGGQSYTERNPVWISGGVERDGFLHWSQPEILFYDPDIDTRMSYPDFIMTEDGRYFFTETQKETARVHQADTALIEGLWAQLEARDYPESSAVTEGFTLLFDAVDSAAPGVMFDGGEAIQVTCEAERVVRLTLNDGSQTVTWDSDPLPADRPVPVGIIVDKAPGIILFVVEGRLCDGGETRQYGWGRIPSDFGVIAIPEDARVVPRALTISEVVIRQRELGAQ